MFSFNFKSSKPKVCRVECFSMCRYNLDFNIISKKNNLIY